MMEVPQARTATAAWAHVAMLCASGSYRHHLTCVHHVSSLTRVKRTPSTSETGDGGGGDGGGGDDSGGRLGGGGEGSGGLGDGGGGLGGGIGGGEGSGAGGLGGIGEGGGGEGDGGGGEGDIQPLHSRTFWSCW